MSKSMTLQEKIKFLRKSIRMSQREFGLEINRSPNMISDYEAGEKLPPYDVLMAIDGVAKKYKIKVQILRD
jgi:transcriptional regulator with XRE-family HTH domain